MLTSQEKKGISDLLDGMDIMDVMSLCSTITNNAVKSKSRYEAEESILRFCQSPQEFLNRKKVKKEVIIQYLRTHTDATLTAKLEKHELVDLCLKTWRSPSTQLSLKENLDLAAIDYPPSRQGISTYSRRGQEASSSAYPFGVKPPIRGLFSSNAVTVNAIFNFSSKDTYNFSSKDTFNFTSNDKSNFSSKDTFNFSSNEKSNFSSKDTFNFSSNDKSNFSSKDTFNFSSNDKSNFSSKDTFNFSSNATPPPNLPDLGREFSNWFYNLLNSAVSNLEYGPHHFWSDCALIIKIQNSFTSASLLHAAVKGNTAVAEALKHMVAAYWFAFKPNWAGLDNLLVSVDANGIIKVEVKGVVHQCSNYVGHFNHKFGLVQDPSLGNNWKVRFFELFHNLNISINFDLPNSVEIH